MKTCNRYILLGVILMIFIACITEAQTGAGSSPFDPAPAGKAVMHGGNIWFKL